MSLIAIPFAVDIEKVKRVFGSKERELLEKIKSAGLYDNYASQSDDFPDPKYRYNFNQALEDIIFHYIRPEDRKAKKRRNGHVRSLTTRSYDQKSQLFIHYFCFIYSLFVSCSN